MRETVNDQLRETRTTKRPAAGLRERRHREGVWERAPQLVPLPADEALVTIGVAFPEILAAARTGAEWAWERLYESIAGGVRGYVAAQGAADPDDLTGEVMLQLVRAVSYTHLTLPTKRIV